MPIIFLSDASITEVDKEDHYFLLGFNWHAMSHNYVGRTVVTETEQITILIHRVILTRMGFTNFEMGDHKDRNPRNNKRENLRPANRFSNQQNADKTTRSTTSKYKGVSWRSGRLKWEAQIYVNGERIRLGLYPTEIQAAYAYNVAATRYFKEFARLNNLAGY